MASTKEKMIEFIRAQPDKSTYDEIMRELIFVRMIERGIADSDKNKLLNNDEMLRRIRTWQKVK